MQQYPPQPNSWDICPPFLHSYAIERDILQGEKVQLHHYTRGARNKCTSIPFPVAFPEVAQCYVLQVCKVGVGVEVPWKWPSPLPSEPFQVAIALQRHLLHIALTIQNGCNSKGKGVTHCVLMPCFVPAKDLPCSFLHTA